MIQPQPRPSPQSMQTKGTNSDYLGEENYISSSDSENDLFKKFPVSSSESESETKQVMPKRHLKRGVRRTLKRFANAGIEAVNRVSKTRRRLNQDADDRRVQAREDIKYARRYPDLRNFQALVTKGQTELDKRGIYQSLLQKTETNGNTVYDNMMKDPIEPPKIELVRDFVNLNFLENIYIIVVRLDDGKEVRIPVTAYLVDSVIQSDDDMSVWYQLTDISLFPYEMIDGKLAALPTYARNVLDLDKMRDNIGIIEDIQWHFPLIEEVIDEEEETVRHRFIWVDNIANQLAEEAILKNLKQIAEEEIKKKLTQGEEVRLYKYNLETGTKENLKVLEKQGPLSSPNVMELLSQFTFGSNVNNRKDFLAKLQPLQGLPLTKEAKATNLQQNMLVNQWGQQWTQPIGEGAAVNEPVRVQTEQQKAMAAARLSAFGNFGGSLHRRTKKKRSKKYRKTNKRRSNKSKKQKR